MASQFCRPSTLPIRNLGVDDWAWRKGQDYGTILVNLDLRRVVDLLPDRAAESFSEWLQQHPEIGTISRDRCGLYAEGATLGPPQSQQIWRQTRHGGAAGCELEDHR
jgi:transposase